MTKFIYLVCIAGLLFSCGTKKSAVTSSSLNNGGRNSASKQSISQFHGALHQYQVLNYDKALTEAQAYTALEPNDDAGYFLLSKIYYELQDSISSLRSLETAASKDPKNNYYHIELGNAYLQAQNFAKSEKEFKFLTDLYPHSAEYQFGLYRSYIGQKKYDKALLALQEIERIKELNPEILIQRYLLFVEKKEYPKAENTLLDGLTSFPGDSQLLYALYDYYSQRKQPEKFQPLLEREIKNAPQNTDLQLLLADFYLQKKEEKKAMDLLIPVFANPEVDVTTKQYFFIDNIVKAENLSLPSAKKLGELTVKINPENAFFNLLLGSIYDDEGNSKKALYYYKSGVDQAENKKETYNRIAYLEYSNEMYDSLAVDTRKALDLFPSESGLYYFSAIGLLRTQQYQKAIDVLNEGMIFITDEMDIADFNSIKAESYFGLKEFEKGKKTYEEAIKSTRDNNYLKVNYALILAKNKVDIDIANQLIDEVIASSKGNQNAFYVKSMILFQKGNYKEAKEILERLLKDNPKDPTIFNDLGNVLYHLHEVDAAVGLWITAATLKEEANEDAELIRRKINDRKYYEE